MEMEAMDLGKFHSREVRSVVRQNCVVDASPRQGETRTAKSLRFIITAEGGDVLREALAAFDRGATEVGFVVERGNQQATGGTSRFACKILRE
jgi:hypothetical protein